MDNEKIKHIINYYNKKEEERCPFPTGIIKVNLKTLETNIKKIHNFANKKAGKKLLFLLPVKGNAYGAGITAVAKFAEHTNLCDYLGVAHLQEAYLLIQEKIKKPILILAQSPITKSGIKYTVKHSIEHAVSDLNFLYKLDKEGQKQEKKVNIHLDIDTGMGRSGVLVDDVLSIINKIKKLKYIHLKGVMTHFPVSDANTKKAIKYTSQQIKKLVSLKTIISQIFKHKIIFHSANSGAALEYPDSLFDMIRPGIAVYGYPEPYGNALKLQFNPVMEIESEITLIKTYPPRHSIGYGRTYITKNKEHIAIVPLGYGDGLNRKLSNNFYFVVNNKKVKSVGRISMDQFCIKVNSKTKTGDKVLIVSRKHHNTARQLAEAIDTIPNEVICNLGNATRLRHKYIYQTK